MFPENFRTFANDLIIPTLYMRPLFLLTFCLFFHALLAQPANDDCAGLVNFGDAPACDGTIYTNVDATLSTISNDFNVPSCFNGGNPDRDVWFQFDVPADGSLVDFRITIEGSGADGIVQPQVAVYRGDCEFDGLQELACASAAVGETLVTLDITGLTPGLSYFLRVNDYSATASPNSGDFTVCVDEIPPLFTMGTDTNASLCAGTLFDSGGPDGDYSNGENNVFTICPAQFHECIILNFAEYSVEDNFDAINVYAGDDVTAPLYFTLDGTGMGQEIPVPSDCVTIQFTSDGSVVESGFTMTWQCTAAPCDVPPISSCDAPTVVPALPYTNDDLGTCFTGNNIPGAGPCNTDFFLAGSDHVLTYDSPGDECVNIQLSNTIGGMGISVYTACPTDAGAECVAVSASGSIPAANFEEPGTYYIVVGSAQNCGDFDISMEVVDCPIIFPPAGFCDDALGINGCDNNQTAIVSIETGPVDEDFVTDLNETCWFGPGAANFTFFFFEAQADGNFGFTIQSQNPDEASDVDFLVWGPVNSIDEMCIYAQNNEADRCSYAAGADPTGLADIHPILNIPVTDFSEGAGGDDFVATLPVETGQFYLVLINDFGGNITSGAAVIDFGATTAGVLGASSAEFMVQGDTAVCENQPAQLLASGGDLYQWFPTDGLSCDDCPNPLATVTQSTTYQVEIRSVCAVDTLSVDVEIFQIDAGPDQTVCLNEEIQIVAGSSNPNAVYQWSGGPAGSLSCTDCPDPIITNSESGVFTYTVSFNAPGCADQTDQVDITVLPVAAAEYSIAPDTSICAGETVMLGGPAQSGNTYFWASDPAGFSSMDANPGASPTVTTTYYLFANNTASGCPQTSVDSTTVTVNQLPVLGTAPDLTICQGESFTFGATTVETDVTYTISPPFGVMDTSDPNSLIFPDVTQNYTLTATRGACVSTENILVTVTAAAAELNVPDSTGICFGETVVLEATISPANAQIEWTNDAGDVLASSGTTLTVAPDDLTTYFITITNGPCVAVDSARIRVDSLPVDMSIMPQDTTVCSGEPVLLVSPIYEPFLFEDIVHQWNPSSGFDTPDTLYNALVRPGSTTTYVRTSTNGFCSRDESVTVNVIEVDDLQILPVDPEVCPGESIQLTLDVPDGAGDIEWMGEGLSCTDCPNPTATPNGTTTYTVSVEFMGCPLSAETTVVVSESPSVSFPALNRICPGDLITLNTNPNMEWTYVWTSTDPNFNEPNSPAPTVSPATSASYTVSVQNGDCPPITATFDLTVVSDVQVTVPSEVVICSDETLDIVAEGTVNGELVDEEYAWFLDGEFISDNRNLNIELEPGTYDLVVNFTDGACLTDEATVNVTVGSSFAVDLTSDDDDGVVFQGTEILLTATTDPDLTGATIVWFENGVVIDGANTLTQMVQPNEVGEVTYTVEITSAEGCTRTATITFVVEPPEYYIPNVITLNNDGLNDTFAPVILGGIELTEMRIYSRWGQLVYTGNGEWDGTRDGKLAPQDVYVYVMTLTLLNGETVIEEGDLTVIR